MTESSPSQISYRASRKGKDLHACCGTNEEVMRQSLAAVGPVKLVFLREAQECSTKDLLK